MTRGQKRALLAVAFSAGIVACTGGLLVDQGNAYSCSFDPSTVNPDSPACPKGWICGIENKCVPYQPDSLPEGPPPTFEPHLLFPEPNLLARPLSQVAIPADGDDSAMAISADDPPRIFRITREAVSADTMLPTSVDVGGSTYDLELHGLGVTSFAPSLNRISFIGTAFVDAGVGIGFNGAAIANGNPPQGFKAVLASLLPKMPLVDVLRARVAVSGTKANPVGAAYLQVGSSTTESSAGEVDFNTGLYEPLVVNVLDTDLDGGAADSGLADGGAGRAYVALDVRGISRSELVYSKPLTLGDCPGSPTQWLEEPVPPLVLTAEGFFFRKCRAIGTNTGPDIWTSLSAPEEASGIPLNQGPVAPPLLRVDPSVSLLAVAFSADIGRSVPLRALSTWRLQRTPGQPSTVTRDWADCTPCAPQDRIIEILPALASGVPVVDVVCEKAQKVDAGLGLGLLYGRRIVGSAGSGVTDACQFQPITPSFDLAEVSQRTVDGPFGFTRLYAINDTTNARVAIGGKHGQIWVGSTLDQMMPMFLDRAPKDVSMFNGNLLALTDSYMATAITAGGGFTVLPPTALTGGTGDPVFPSSVPTDVDGGLSGWVMLSTGDLAKVLPDGGEDGGISLVYGAELLDNSGRPAQEPYRLEGTVYAGTTEKHFIVSASDSLYDSKRAPLTDQPRELPPLTPVLTLQSGSAISALALDRSPQDLFSPDYESGPLVLGYALAGRSVYQFSFTREKGYKPAAISVPSGEPMSLWMASELDPRGRVGFREGNVYSLPNVLPLVQSTDNQMPSCDAPPDAHGVTGGRVVDFANLGGWPIAVTDHSLLRPQRTGAKDVAKWCPVPLPPELVPSDGGSVTGLQNAKLFVWPGNGTQTLYLFTGYGYVYELATLKTP